MSAFIEFIHVLFGVSFFGMIIASLVTITSAICQKEAAVRRHMIKASLFYDCLMLPVIVMVVITGAFMANIRQIPTGASWLADTYLLFFLASVVWFSLLFIKLKNLSQKEFLYKKLFYILNAMVMLLFFLIIHDLVTHQPFF